MLLDRARRLLPGLWAGLLLTVALVATPAPFALLTQADAGRVVSRVLAQEAYASLALGVLLLVLERLLARRQALTGRGTQFSLGMVLCLGALFCTVAGYFALQPLMAQARQGQGVLGFGQLHAISAAFYLVKCGLVLVLAWRAAAPPASSQA
ncbi:MAG: DUF4149 domain-containing protein [Rubrivivax sp.]|nr:DUF4149 domain-containing protein [Rubrivivax sp.]